MNNTCPNCNAVYNVAAKDIGRRIRCKKCQMPLIVTEAGLEVDQPVPAAAPLPPAAPIVGDEDDEEIVSTSKGRGKDRGRRYGGSAPGVGETIRKIGGVPTLLFGFGVFLVIVFAFMPIIGQAATARAEATAARLRLDQQAELKKLLPKGKTSPAELDGEEAKKYADEAKKINDRYAKLIAEANEDAAVTAVDNVRAVRFERYGSLFGFLFVAFGCIGYLRTEQPLVMWIVAGAILTLMMLVVFVQVGGCGGLGTPNIKGLGKGIE